MRKPTAAKPSRARFIIIVCSGILVGAVGLIVLIGERTRWSTLAEIEFTQIGEPGEARFSAKPGARLEFREDFEHRARAAGKTGWSPAACWRWHIDIRHGDETRSLDCPPFNDTDSKTVRVASCFSTQEGGNVEGGTDCRVNDCFATLGEGGPTEVSARLVTVGDCPRTVTESTLRVVTEEDTFLPW